MWLPLLVACAPDPDRLHDLAVARFGDQPGTVQVQIAPLESEGTCCPDGTPTVGSPVLLTHPDDVRPAVFLGSGQVDAACMKAKGLLAEEHVRQKTLFCDAQRAKRKDFCSPARAATLAWTDATVLVPTADLETLRTTGGSAGYPRYVAARKRVAALTSIEKLEDGAIRAKFPTSVERTALGDCLTERDKDPSDLPHEKELTYRFDKVDGEWR
jgi:hypothetical protein